MKVTPITQNDIDTKYDILKLHKRMDIFGNWEVKLRNSLKATMNEFHIVAKIEDDGFNLTGRILILESSNGGNLEVIKFE